MARNNRRVVPNTDPASLGLDTAPPSAEREALPPQVDESVNADADWRRSSTLDAPVARQGFTQMWIRVEADGKPDGRNYSRKYREGWRPRDPATVPEGFSPPTIRHGNQTVIGAQGMILCEMPNNLAAKRRLYVKERTDRQMQAVEQNLMRVERPGRPIDKTFKESVGRGKGATIAED